MRDSRVSLTFHLSSLVGARPSISEGLSPASHPRAVLTNFNEKSSPIPQEKFLKIHPDPTLAFAKSRPHIKSRFVCSEEYCSSFSLHSERRFRERMPMSRLWTRPLTTWQ